MRTGLDALQARASTPPAPTRDPIRAALEELCRLPPEESHRVLSRLVREPEACLPELARIFPGPTWFDRRLPYRRVPRAAEASPITAAMAAIGEPAVPHVLPLLKSESADQRFFAAIVVMDLGVRRLESGTKDTNDLLGPVAQLLLDADAGVRGAAREAVWALRSSSGYPAMLEGFRRCAADRGVQQVWRVRAIEALAELGDAMALDMLIEQLVDDDRTIARAAHESLRRLTCHDLGSMRMAWRRWSKSQGRRHRFDWLVDALADRREDLRIMALRELRRLSGESFGLTELSPRSACIEAQQKYLRWWQARR
ncbi:MAG: hypothetical protein KF901_33985 [Myxococcales bacterium]|nr:hypothetical protein [Myxococcales bacterium]